MLGQSLSQHQGLDYSRQVNLSEGVKDDFSTRYCSSTRSQVRHGQHEVGWISMRWQRQFVRVGQFLHFPSASVTVNLSSEAEKRATEAA